jgi:hypothetical protein
MWRSRLRMGETNRREFALAACVEAFDENKYNAHDEHP